MLSHTFLAGFILLSWTIAVANGSAARSNERFILDTDIASDVDDAYALILLADVAKGQLAGVTTASGPTGKRAQVTAKLLDQIGRGFVPVYLGRETQVSIGAQYEWANSFESGQIKKTSAVEFMHEEIAKHPGQITLIAIGPLTNLGDLFSDYPGDAGKLKGIVMMGGSAYIGYNQQKPPVPEYNIYTDVDAARKVFSCGAPIFMAGLDVTAMLQLNESRRARLFAANSPATRALQELTKLWGNGTPTLFDPFAVAYATGHVFCETELARVEVADNGLTRLVDGPPNVTVMVKPRPSEFLDWYVDVVGKAKS